MKKKILSLFFIVSSIILANNLLKNGDFQKELSREVPDKNGYVDTNSSWIKHFNSGGAGSIEIVNGEVIAVSKNENAPEHGVQLIQAPIQLNAGAIYEVSFKIEGEKETEVTVKIGADADRGYYAYSLETIEIKPGKKEYKYSFEMLAETDLKGRFEFWFTKTTIPVKIKDVKLKEIGKIEENRMINLRRFDKQEKYNVLRSNINELSDLEISNIKKLKINDIFQKKIDLEKDGKYVVNINGLGIYEIGLVNNDGFTEKVDLDLSKEKNKQIVLEYKNKSEKNGKFYIKKLSKDGKLDKVELKKYIGNLLWSDEFEYEGLPLENKWTYEVGGHGWGNAELQYYTNGNPNNVNVKNGNLIITAKKESLENNDYTSTRIVSKNKNDMLYGRIEIKAKLPSAVGTWPAIWMMPTDSEYGEWPKSGEIDIMEHVGYDLGVVHGTVHTEKYYWKKSNQKGAKIDVANPDENFAVYAMEWTPNIIKIYKDNILYFEYEKEELSSDAWPFDKKFYLIMNIAVGGAWGGQQGVDENNFPQEMVIDYVRVYDLGIDNN